MNKTILLIFLALLSSCSHLSKGSDEAKEILLQKLRPGIEKIISQESPIDPPERSSYLIVHKLPGASFNPRHTIRSLFTYDLKGRLLLTEGDYTFPVMTYCMKSLASSPAGHIYSLSKLEGNTGKNYTRTESLGL